MNRLLLILTILLCSFQQPDSDRLKVIKVVGTIVVKDTQKLLITGDEITSKMLLDCKTPEARAAVIDTETKNMFILTCNSQTSDNKNASAAVAKTHLIPETTNISTRSGGSLNVNDIRNYFTGNFVVLNKAAIKINPQNYPMDSKHWFYLHYMYNGEEINKKLKYKNDVMYFDKKKIYKVDNQIIARSDDNKVKLYYMKDNKSALINEFNLVFPDNNSLKQEIGVFWNEINKSTFEEKVEEVISYIGEFYGKPDKDNVVSWLKENF
jgi:hypothetical protein